MMNEFTTGIRTAFEICQMSLVAPLGSTAPRGVKEQARRGHLTGDGRSL